MAVRGDLIWERNMNCETLIARILKTYHWNFVFRGSRRNQSCWNPEFSHKPYFRYLPESVLLQACYCVVVEHSRNKLLQHPHFHLLAYCCPDLGLLSQITCSSGAFISESAFGRFQEMMEVVGLLVIVSELCLFCESGIGHMSLVHARFHLGWSLRRKGNLNWKMSKCPQETAMQTEAASGKPDNNSIRSNWRWGLQQ